MALLVDADLAPSNSGSWATHTDTYGKGGFRTVADNTARDAITTARRSAGMLVYSTASAALYQLGPGLTNSDWAVASFGGSADFKDSVRLATAAAMAASTRVSNVRTANANGAMANIDGVAPVVGNRILDKDNATGADRGIWTVTSLGSAGTPWVLTRATDADVSAEVTAGMAAIVEEGTANTGKLFVLTTANPITLNTTSLTFTAISGGAGTGDFKADGTVAMTADLNLNTHKATGMVAGTASTDGVNKGQLDGVFGLIPTPGGAPVDVTKAAASAGSGTAYSLANHKHDISTAAPGAINLSGAAAAEGSSTATARADHGHSLTGTLGVGSGGTGLTSPGAAGRVLTSDGSGWVSSAPNAAGGGDGFRFTYSTTTTDADPGAGTFRGNNATLNLVTTLYVDLAEYGATDVTAWLDSLDDAGAAILGRLRLQSISDATKWIIFNLTGWTTATGYRKLTVAYVAGPGGLTTTAGDTFLSFDRGMGSGDFGSTNIGTTGYAFVGSGTKSTTGTGFRLPAAVTAYFRNNANSADIRLFGIGDDGADVVNWGDTFYGMEWSEVAAGRVVLGLCVGSKLTTAMMPSSTGSRVVYLSEAATQPSTGKPSGGIVLWVGDDRLRAKTTSHPTNGAWDMVPNSSFSRYYPPEGAIETSGTSIATVQTIDTSLLPDECSGIIRTYLSCADTGSLATQVISSTFARRAGVLVNSGAGALKDGVQTQGVASYDYSSDNLLVRVTPTGVTNYRWTALTELIFSSHTNAE